MKDGMSEVRSSIRMIEAEIVGALHRLRDLARCAPAQAQDGMLLEALRLASAESKPMEEGMSEVRSSIRVIETGIVGALRRLKDLARCAPARAQDGTLLEAIMHLGEALHEVQQALAHTRPGERDFALAAGPGPGARALPPRRGEERGQA